uniref:NACHT domain-containing protein n=1 Tax=Strigamia maritima TaxID=126957 RepID=T1IIG3_STRMM
MLSIMCVKRYDFHTNEEQSPLIVEQSGTRRYSGTQEDNGDMRGQNIVDQTSKYLVPSTNASRDHSLQNSTENQLNSDQQIEHKTQELQKKLKYIYNKAVLPHVAWLKKGKELPIKEYFVPFQLMSSGSNVVLQDLFSTDAKRILLEGYQGYGKSTLCYKILNDWASDTLFDNFKLVFILPIRNLNQMQAKDIIEALAKIYSMDKQDEFRTVVENNIEDTLFIIDGLDELPEDLESIKHILSVDAKSILLVTCRTGSMASTNSIELLNKKNYNKCIEIHGIATEKRKEFLEKFFPTEVIDTVMTNLENDPLLISLNELFKCPLFLGLLGIAVDEKKEPIFTTKTDLFKQIINCAIKLSIDTDNEEFDIFDEKCMSANGFSEFVRGFSKLLVTSLPDKKSVFANDKFTHEMHRLGLMTCHNEIYTLREKTYYEIFHASLTEFLVAFRLVAEFRENNYTFDKNFVEYINAVVVEKGSSSLILPFLIGLLDDKADDFFVQMAPFATIYSSQEILAWSIMFESTLKDESIEKFKRFLPSEVHQSEDSSLKPFYESSKHAELIKLGIESRRIEYIHYSPNSNVKLPSNVTIPVLEIDANNEICTEALQNLNVRNLLSKFGAIKNKEEANNVFNFLTSIPSIERHTFKLTNVENFSNCPLENIQNLICEDSMAAEKIISTLQNEEKKIEKLQLVLSNSSSLGNIKNIFNHISQLTFFHFENKTKENIEFDPQHFAPHEEKSLVLHNVKLTQPQSDQKWNLHYVDIDDSSPETATALTSITMKVLSCSTRLLYTLHKIEPREWPGYESIEEIVLKVDDSALKPQVWHNLSSYKNLKTLAIYLQKRSNKQYWGIDEIQESILSLPITNFIIWAVEFNVQSVGAFCSKIKEYMLEKNQCNYENITLFVGDATEEDLAELQSVFADLLQCVKSDKLKSVSICCANVSIWPIVLRQQIIDTSVLAIEHDVCGSKDYDSYTSKVHLREYLKICNRFRITKIVTM